MFGPSRSAGHFLAALVLLASTSSSAPAAAGNFCENLRQVLQAIRADLEVLRGPQRMDTDAYSVQVALPGARDCELFDFIVVDYSCQWAVRPATVDRARALVRQIVAATNQCIAPSSLALDRQAERPTWRLKEDAITIEVVGGDSDEVRLSVSK